MGSHSGYRGESMKNCVFFQWIVQIAVAALAVTLLWAWQWSCCCSCYLNLNFPHSA